MRPLTAAALLFLTVAAVHSTSNVSVQGDSRWTIPLALSLIHSHTLNLDEYASLFPRQNFYFIECVTSNHVRTFPTRQTTCPGGHFYYFYPAAVSMMAAPLVVIIEAGVSLMHPAVSHFAPKSTAIVAAFFQGDFVTGSPIVEILIASFFTAAAASILFLALLEILSLKEAAAVACVFAFCTSAWSLASRALFQHAPSMFLAGILLLLLFRSEKRPNILWLIGPIATLAFFVRPTNLVPLVVFALYLIVRAPRQAIWAAAVALPVAALFTIVTYRTYGMILAPYFFATRSAHTVLSLHSKVGEALLGNLISPARGLLVFCPFLVLLFFPIAWRTDLGPAFRRLRPYLIAIVFLHCVLVSLYDLWWAGYAYGPRYMCDLLPYLMVLMAPVFHSIFKHQPGFRLGRAILAPLLVIALFIHARGAYSIVVHDWNSTPVSVDDAPWRVWDWSDPPFLRGL